MTGDPRSWLKAFESDWLPDYKCCQVFKTNDSKFCSSFSENREKCTECPDKDTRKLLELKWFLTDIPSIRGCVNGGKPLYGKSVNFTSAGDIRAGFFTMSHSKLSKSEDFISSRKSSLKLAKYVNEYNPNITVFPYSAYYHFYEQYDTIIQETVTNVLICLTAVFLMSSVLLGFHMKAAFTLLLSVFMIVLDMLGMMVLADIPLNAISLVNIIMSTGISVEFSAHIIKSFLKYKMEDGINTLAAYKALTNTGPAILSGITLTKIFGIFVLIFAKSKLFQVFYFRMFLSVILLGACHSLIFLPVFLDLF